MVTTAAIMTRVKIAKDNDAVDKRSTNNEAQVVGGNGLALVAPGDGGLSRCFVR